MSEKLGDEVKAQYIEIEGNGLLSRATLWETGNLVLEAIDIESEQHAISEIYEL
ncbi:immunity protein TriTu family protein [Vibrio parahaemolyticus]